MSTFDPSIILQGRQFDPVGALNFGAEAAFRGNEMEQQNALRQFLAQNGAGVMSGDEAAMAGFARFDPIAAADLMRQRELQARDAQRFEMEQARFARDMAPEEPDEAAFMEGVLRGAVVEYQRGDKKSVAAWFAQNGIDPAAIPYEMVPTLAAQFGVADPGDFAPAAPPVPQSAIAKLEADLRAGLISPEQYQLEVQNMAPTPSTTVEVNTGSNSNTFTDAGDKAAADRFSGYIEAGQRAGEMLGDLQMLTQIAGQLQTGKWADLTARYGSWLEAAGVDVAGLGEAEGYQAIVDRLVPQMRPPGSGAASDFDGRQFLSALPNLSRTPQGNQIITETFGAIMQHRQAVAQIAAEAFELGTPWQDAEAKIRALGNPYEAFNAYSRGATQGEARDFSSATLDDLLSMNVLEMSQEDLRAWNQALDAIGGQ
jgi:hypothetical protein